MPSANPLAIPRPPICATILTGFLGAGKTTLLNRYLATQPARRSARAIRPKIEICENRSYEK